MANDTKIIITAQTAQAEGALRSFGQSVDAVSTKMFDMGQMAGTLAGALSVTAFTHWIKSSIDAADQLYKLSQKTGAAVEDLAGLKFAAEQNEVSLETVANAAKKLSVQLVDKPEIFKSIGVTAKDSTGALVQLADIFASMPDGVEKTALSVKLMGRNGEEMIPFLNQGSEALQRLIDQGKRYNPVTAENALAAQQFNDQLNELKASAGSLGIRIANQMLPALDEITQAMNEAAKSGSLLKTAWIGLGGLGTAFYTYEFADTANKIERLNTQLTSLEAHLKVRSAFGSGFLQKIFLEPESNIEANIAKVKKHIADLTAQLNRPVPPVIKRLDDGRGNKLLDAYRTGGTKTQDDFESFQKRLLIDLAPVEDGKQTRADKLQVELNLDKTISAIERDKLQLLINQLRVQDLALLAKKSEREGQQVIIGLEKDFHNELEKRQDALNAPLLSASERQLAEDLRAVAKRAQDARIELEKLQVSGSLSAADLDRRLQQVNSDEQAQKDAITALKIEQDKMNASWEYGANVALRSYMDEIANVAKQSESAMTRAFRGMEEALVNFVKTGKLDFKSLADSIISDLIRMQVQQSIMKPLTSAIESAGGIGGIFGSIFGSSSGSPAASSSAVSQYSLASGASSFGLQVPAFATGIDYVPRDMIAQIHKGERITRAVDNRPGFGGNITVNVTGTNADSVRRAAGQGAREAMIMFNRAGRYL